jgi:hypothetical protein
VGWRRAGVGCGRNGAHIAPDEQLVDFRPSRDGLLHAIEFGVGRADLESVFDPIAKLDRVDWGHAVPRHEVAVVRVLITHGNAIDCFIGERRSGHHHCAGQ